MTIADRREALREKVGSSVTVVTREELENRREWFALEALKHTPGINVTRTGGPGQRAKLYMRGGEPRHVAFLVDGVEVRDAAGFEVPFLTHLGLAEVERIEVVRGPRSSTYGSNALAGAVNIIRSRPAEGRRSSFGLEHGPNSTYAGFLSTAGKAGAFRHAVTVSRYETEGYSVVRGGAEADGYRNLQWSGSLGYELGHNRELNLVGHVLRINGDVDNMATDDEAGWRYVGQERMLRLSLDKRNKAGQLIDSLSATWTNFTREDVTSRGNNTYLSRSRRAEWMRSFRLGEWLDAQAGLRYEEEEGVADDFFAVLPSHSVYLRNHMDWGELSIDAGVRVDDHDRYGVEETWHMALSRSIGGNTRWLTSVGTGFLAPNASYLNPAWSAIDPDRLRAERSFGWDMGLEQGCAEGNIIAGVTFFATDYDDQLTWTTGWENLDETRSWGVETYVLCEATQNLELSLNWTYLEAMDQATGKQLDFRPENVVNAKATWKPIDEVRSTLACRYVSESFNPVWVSSNQEVNSAAAHAVWDWTVRYLPGEASELFLRAENVFDRDYAEMCDPNGKAYATQGRAVSVGFRYAF